MTDRVKQNHEYHILSSAEIAHSTQWQCNNFATHSTNTGSRDAIESYSFTALAVIY